MKIGEFRKYLLTLLPEGYKVREELLYKDIGNFSIGIQVYRGKGKYNCALYLYIDNDFAVSPLIFSGEVEELKKILGELIPVLESQNLEDAIKALEANSKKLSNDLTAVHFGKFKP